MTCTPEAGTHPRAQEQAHERSQSQARRRAGVDATVAAALALALWAALIAFGRAWGLALDARGQGIALPTPPLLGQYQPELPLALWLPVVTGLVAVAALPWLARRWRWRPTLAVAGVAVLAWWVALALVDGTDGLARGLHWDDNYAPIVSGIARDPLGFLRGFVDAVPSYSVDVRAHPPGFPLVLGALERLGLGGPGWATALVLVAAASAVPAVLVAVRDLAGEAMARAALPFVVLAPAALWLATSADAFYVATSTWLIALVARSLTTEGQRAVAWAVAAGVLAAVVALQSYGLVLMACPIVLMAVVRRRWQPVVVAAGVAAALLLALLVTGYWYLDGYFATKHEYDTLPLSRPYSFFFFSNLAAWALALGPATAVALVRLRDRGLWAIVGGGLAAAAAANLSGLSEGEVERIWLPFTILVLPAGAALATGPRGWRAWLAAQALTPIVVLALIRPHW